MKVRCTDGKAMGCEKLELPDGPLIERAEKWGTPVKAIS